MFVVPAATAHLCTDRLWVMIVVSALFAALAAVLGHVGAIVVPQLIGYRSTNTAGMMAVAAGLLFAGGALFAPRYGMLMKFARRRLLTLQILAEDALARLYRAEERSQRDPESAGPLATDWPAGPLVQRAALAWLRLRGEIEQAAETSRYALTDRGRRRAHALVRAHRLWEHYLVTTGGLAESRLHDSAERLEHFTDDELRRRLDDETASPRVDPHGAPIPPELRR
jgi:manganese/zinc/iron transport system permease protein